MKILIILLCIFNALIMFEQATPQLDIPVLHLYTAKMRFATAFIFCSLFACLITKSNILKVIIASVNLFVISVISLTYQANTFSMPSIATLAVGCLYFFTVLLQVFTKETYYLYLLGGILGVFAIIGYIFNAPFLYFYSSTYSTAMSLTTAIETIIFSFILHIIKER